MKTIKSYMDSHKLTTTYNIEKNKSNAHKNTEKQDYDIIYSEKI